MAETLIERSIRLAPEPDSPAAARRLLRQVLDDCAKPDWRDSAELALSELVTNAVLHAHTALLVRLRCGPGQLRVEVEDQSSVLPQQRSYGETSSTGRGLALVAAVAHDHGTERTDTGKIVWFVLDQQATDQDDEIDVDTLLDTWADDDLLEPPQPSDARTVTLRGFPPTLWLAAVQMHDALLREMALLRAGRGLDTGDLAAADRARFTIRTVLDATLAERTEERTADEASASARHPTVLQEVAPTVDLVVPLGPGAAEDFSVLQDVLDEANRLAGQGQLLTRAALPEVIALRDWCCEQIISGLSGLAPMPWPGADAEHFIQLRDHAAREFDYDVTAATDGPRTAIVVDAGNRILGISGPLAARIGWAADDLIGRRVVAIVPPRLREAHVSGLTRHLSTGQAHALRVDLQLPVLCADGTELLCDFYIDDDRSRSGHPVYIAYVTPVLAPSRH